MPLLSLEPLHRFHPYCARFPSEIVESVLEQYSEAGDSVFDPFCGSGTTLVAGLAHQRRVVGGDIDMLAGMLSELKCAPLAPERYAEWRAQFAARLVQLVTIKYPILSCQGMGPSHHLGHGFGGPVERMRMLIPFVNKLAELRVEVLLRFKVGDAQAFALEDTEPWFHLIHP